MLTTMALMTTAAPNRTGKFPASVARTITAQSPDYRECQIAEFEVFRDDASIPRPPEAVMKPVIS
jgi:hypothetical protein